MTRTDVDVAVIGGGVVGLAAALMAARQGLQVALVEAHAPKPWNAETPDLRVYALALDNEALLASFGLWQDIAGRRAYPYAEKMWELNAMNQCIVYSSTLGQYSIFEQAFNWRYLGAGSVFGLLLFAGLWTAGAPIMPRSVVKR